MPLERPISFDDAARGIALTVQGGAVPRIDLTYKAEGDVVVSAQVDIAPGDRGALADLAALIAEPGAPHLEEQRLRFQNLSRRAGLVLPTAARALRGAAHWLLSSREDTNYTYDLTPQNKLYLAHLLATVTGCPVAEIKGYISEIENDRTLRDHIAANLEAQGPAARAVTDATTHYGRRIGWYALARVLKPRLVIETGIDKGLGSVVLCAALLRNRAEGHAGRYLGTDLRPDAGAFLTGRYREVGDVAYGDSIASLQKISEPVDLFINDSDHAADYEAREFEVIAPRLSDRAVVLGDNAHSTSKLVEFAEATGRRFVFFREQPQDHFYPGAGIGIAFG